MAGLLKFIKGFYVGLSSLLVKLKIFSELAFNFSIPLLAHYEVVNRLLKFFTIKGMDRFAGIIETLDRLFD